MIVLSSQISSARRHQNPALEQASLMASYTGSNPEENGIITEIKSSSWLPVGISKTLGANVIFFSEGLEEI
jgi:hypothetical protein